MPCFHPLEGYRAVQGGITWTPSKAYVDTKMTVSCGQCTGCRLERSRNWAVRIMNEAQLHPHNSFITLTYNEEHLPDDLSLDVSHFQRFIKRTRRRFPDEPIRYFHVGEYGPKHNRPHYHACLFGCPFLDRRPWKRRRGHQTYRSAVLEELWTYGNSELGSLTFESAAYVARYITKKVTGQGAEAHYSTIDSETGEIRERKPEYATMSRRPGIGRDWLERYEGDVYPSDEIIMRGKPSRPPRYYDKVHQERNPEEHEAVLERRQKARNRAEETPERLQVRKVCAEARLNLFSPRDGVT